MKRKYQTKQRERVEQVFRSGKDYSCQDIAKELKEKNMAVSIPTIYRQVAGMVDEGLLHTYYVDGKTRYRLAKERNQSAQVRCKGCGSTDLLECHDLKEFQDHVFKDHHFKLDTESLIFYGICEACMDQKDQKDK
ncbi:MAG: transcriptional repressor [Tissierellia bacterium]|nr:transcriptional repressor [Tissierellia bacterium]